MIFDWFENNSLFLGVFFPPLFPNIWGSGARRIDADGARASPVPPCRNRKSGTGVPSG